METKGKRLDVELVERGLAASRQQAKNRIEAGRVLINGKPAGKASQMVKPEDVVTVTGEEDPFVSRGGFKLAGALERFDISMKDLVCLDAGASTGGFTDCLLQKGAKRVYAVDVGHDQLAEKLRQDARVVSMENQNIRYFTTETLPEQCDFACADLSFISLTKVLPAIGACVKQGASLVCLIKPQFEAGPGQVGKHGIVKDSRVHHKVLTQVCAEAAALGLTAIGLMPSPIKGQDGNTEFLVHWIKESKENGSLLLPELIEKALTQAKSLKEEAI